MAEKFEIKQISEKEIMIGKGRYYLDQDNILFITPIGNIGDIGAANYKKAFYLLMETVETKADLLIDLNKALKQSSLARKTWKELSEFKKTGKIAIYGFHPVAKLLASFVMGIVSNKEMRFFSTKKEATSWLKQ